MFDPKKLLYTKQHVWVKIKGETAVIGITDELQDMLQAISDITLPKVADELDIDQDCGFLEYNGNIFDILSPLTGRVIRVNKELKSEPELLHSSPYGKGWIFEMEYDEPDELDLLLSASDYIEELENI